MLELGVLICDAQQQDIEQLEKNLHEFMSKTYTGDIQLRFHRASNFVVAKEKIRQFRESLAVIVIDLCLVNASKMVEFEQDLSELKDPNTRICYVGSSNEVEETALYLKRAYNLTRHNHAHPAEMLHRGDPRLLEAVMHQAMGYAMSSSREDPKLLELKERVDQMDRKLFYVSENTTSPPLAQMVHNQQRMGAANAKDIRRLYEDTAAMEESIDVIDRRVKALEEWREYWSSVRKTFLSFDGGWLNEILKNTFFVTIGAALTRLLLLLFG